MNNAKKEKKTIEWERLEISSRKLKDIKGTFHAKMDTIKERKIWTQEKNKILRRDGKDTQKNYTKRY